GEGALPGRGDPDQGQLIQAARPHPLGEGFPDPSGELDEGRVALEDRLLGQFLLRIGVETVVLVYDRLDPGDGGVDILGYGDGRLRAAVLLQGEGDAFDGVADLVGA